MAKHAVELPPGHPDAPHTQPSPDERCDRSHVERAYLRVTSPTGGHLALCRYHYRQHQVALAMEGWSVEEIEGTPE